MGEPLVGRKTYIIAVIAILATIGQFVAGEIALGQAILQVLGALGLSALRVGLK